MFDPTSRYDAIDEATIDVVGEDGRTSSIPYVTRRMITDAEGDPIAERQVGPGERVDQLSAKLLGDPRLFWLLADSNQVLRPSELTDEPGRWIVVHVPNPGGR